MTAAQNNAWRWHELVAGDLDAAAAFYSTVFGWKTVNRDFGGQPYRMLSQGGVPIAGVAASEGGAPTRWTVYLSVTDVEQTRKAVETAGGKVLFGPVPVPGVGVICGCVDPVGAEFMLMEPEPR